MTLTALVAFTAYRASELDAEPPRSGPRTDYAVGAVIEDATEAEAESWLAAGLVRRGSSVRVRGATSEAEITASPTYDSGSLKADE